MNKPTIGEMYNPLIEAAKTNNPQAMILLHNVGFEIFKHNLI